MGLGDQWETRRGIKLNNLSYLFEEENLLQRIDNATHNQRGLYNPA